MDHYNLLRSVFNNYNSLCLTIELWKFMDKRCMLKIIFHNKISKLYENWSIII